MILDLSLLSNIGIHITWWRWWFWYHKRLPASGGANPLVRWISFSRCHGLHLVSPVPVTNERAPSFQLMFACCDGLLLPSRVNSSGLRSLQLWPTIVHRCGSERGVILYLVASLNRCGDHWNLRIHREVVRYIVHTSNRQSLGLEHDFLCPRCKEFVSMAGNVLQDRGPLLARNHLIEEAWRRPSHDW